MVHLFLSHSLILLPTWFMPKLYDLYSWFPLLLKLLSPTVEDHKLKCKGATSLWFPAPVGVLGLLIALVSLVNSVCTPTEATSDTYSAGVSLTCPSLSLSG